MVGKQFKNFRLEKPMIRRGGIGGSFFSFHLRQELAQQAFEFNGLVSLEMREQVL
jgi:hypothetical protein